MYMAVRYSNWLGYSDRAKETRCGMSYMPLAKPHDSSQCNCSNVSQFGKERCCHSHCRYFLVI